MKSITALSSVALLSLLWEKQHNDYIDVIGNFVLMSLPQSIGNEIDIEMIVKTLRNEYGFEDIPPQVIIKVLNRLSRNKSGITYVKRNDKNNRKYYTNEVYDRGHFIKDQEKINFHISEMLKELVIYLENNYLHKKLTQNEAADYLFRFFETYGLTLVHDSSMLRSITANSGEQNFYVARFIMESVETNTTLKTRLVEITKGFLIYKAVYFYSNEYKTDAQSKLRGTQVYLDCSIVIDALGYDSSNDEQSFDEMCQLIRANGGQICVFEHTVEETSRLLEAYARNPQRRNAFSFPGLEKRSYPSEVILSLAQTDSIIANLRQKGISVIQLPSYEPKRMFSGKMYYAGHQDEEAIQKQLEKYQKPIKESQSRSDKENLGKGHHRNKPIQRASRIEYDVKTLSAIGRLRRGKQPCRIENCIAIVATQDTNLCRCMHDLYPNQFPPEISFAINDIDLVSLLWLSQYNAQSHLPQNILIAYAVAACQVSQELMDQAIELAYKMQRDKAISQEAALAIRSAPAIRRILFEQTHNNPAKLTTEAIQSMLSAYVKSESQNETVAAIDAAVVEATSELNKQFEDQLQSVRSELKQSEHERRQQVIEIRKDVETYAEKRASFAAQTVKYLLMALWLIIILGAIFCWLKSGITINTVAAIVLSLLGLLQIADYILKFINIPEKAAKRVREYIFKRVYSKELLKREKISHISLCI